VALLGALLTACSSGVGNDDSVDTQLCTLEDLGGGYLEQARGDFDRDDLAGIAGAGKDGRVEVFGEAGLVKGRFVFWKQTLPKPPFEMPMNVLCQALVFESDEAAAEWVSGLTADADLLAAGLIGWLPEDSRGADERTFDATDLAPGTRVFRLDAGSGDQRAMVLAMFEPVGELVRITATGGPGQAEDRALAVLDGVWTEVHARLGGKASSE